MTTIHESLSVVMFRTIECQTISGMFARCCQLAETKIGTPLAVMSCEQQIRIVPAPRQRDKFIGQCTCGLHFEAGSMIYPQAPQRREELRRIVEFQAEFTRSRVSSANIGYA